MFNSWHVFPEGNNWRCPKNDRTAQSCVYIYIHHLFIHIYIIIHIYIYIIDIDSYIYIHIYMCSYFSIGFLTINHPAIGVPMIHRASPNLILKGPSWKLGGKSPKMADFRGTLW